MPDLQLHQPVAILTLDASNLAARSLSLAAISIVLGPLEPIWPNKQISFSPPSSLFLFLLYFLCYSHPPPSTTCLYISMMMLAWWRNTKSFNNLCAISFAEQCRESAALNGLISDLTVGVHFYYKCIFCMVKEVGDKLVCWLISATWIQFPNIASQKNAVEFGTRLRQTF